MLGKTPLAALAAISISISFAHTARAADPIPLGAILSITGPIAGVGQPERDGALLAEKAINAAGGINGRPLRLTIEDDASNPDTAIAKANSLIRETKVKAIIGSTGLAATVAIGGLTDGVKMPQVALSGIGPAIESKRSCVLHLLAPQELNARAALTYLRDNLKISRFAVLHDSGYGQAVFNSIKAVVGDYGLTIVGAEKFEIGATDVTAQAAKVKAASPQAVVIVASSATPFRNVHDVRIGVPVVASIASASYEYILNISAPWAKARKALSSLNS